MAPSRGIWSRKNRGVNRNNKEDWIVRYMKGLPNTTNNLLELLVIMQELKLALIKGFTPLQVNTDSIRVIDMITNGHLPYDSTILEPTTI